MAGMAFALRDNETGEDSVIVEEAEGKLYLAVNDPGVAQIIIHLSVGEASALSKALEMAVMSSYEAIEGD